MTSPLKFMLATTCTLALLASAAQARLTQPAQEFARQAAISSEFELQSSKLALQKAQSEEVKDFAQQMIDDHTQASTRLRDALKEADADPAALASTSLDAKHQALLDGLTSAQASNFDQQYITAQKQAHQEALTLFGDYAENGDNEDLKDFAENTLSTLQEHHEQVKELSPTPAR